LEIYYTDINEWKERTLFEKGLALLQQERQQKVEACRFEDDRSRSLAAGLLIRHACLQRGLDYGSMRFYRSDSGKPLAEGLQFNVSHSGAYAVIASGDAPMGIDIECLEGRFSGEKGAARLERVIQRTFDEKEKELWEAYRTEGILSEKALTFAAGVWTRKESFAKECGAGLGMDFSCIHTQNLEGFFTFELPEHYVVSVFTKNPVQMEFPVCVHAAEMLR
jgi:4'-phosphopantetheinyl transferase